MNNGGTTDDRFWKSIYGDTHCSWDDPSWGGSVNGNSYYNSDWIPKKNKRRHEFSPVLLVITTVYNCKHCGAKKEDCLSDYCEDSPPDFDTGGW